MLDNLHPAARSAVVLCVIAPLVALLGGFIAAVLAAGGVTDVDWGNTATTALDTAGVALATGIATFLALYVTPLTARYGVGAGKGDGGA
jgi:ABC-type transporter Mla maintaining outer membrane lipid asymmetry permease subunit MlaE